ncbi:MAG: sortase, partial [Anaerolineaceae bacterium]|nr:sortase [Anaerolineaceae bacterium]
VRAFGELHIYEIRSMKNVGSDDLSILKHEEKPWLTLMTCDKYDETKAAYLECLVVRAVLVHTQADISAYPGR